MVQGDAPLECLGTSKGPNIMGSDLMQALGFFIRDLVAEQHSLLDPGRYGSRNNIFMENLPEGHKNQIVTFAEVIGPV